MNAGAYGGELKDVVTEVTALYPDGVKVLTPAELDFSYRHSVFSAGEGIVLGAKVKLESGDRSMPQKSASLIRHPPSGANGSGSPGSRILR